MKMQASRRGSIQLRTIPLQLAFALHLLLGPLDGQAQQIACGQTITDTINSPGQTNTYTFAANAGETVTIIATNGAGSNLTPAAFLAGPNGTIIANWVNGVTTLDVVSTGTYTVGVYSYLARTGTYSLALSYTKLVPASYRLAIDA